MNHLQMAFRAYRQRYQLPKEVAYKLARYWVMEPVTIHEGWLRYHRGEVPGVKPNA